MKMTGLLAEKGLHALKSAHMSDVPKIWVVIAGVDQIEVWGKGQDGFEILFNAASGLSKEIFFQEFLEWLSVAREHDAVDRIILIASAEILAVFHDLMPTDILACTAAEIPKDLIGMLESERKKAIDSMF